jgi:hypothetical protein
MSGSPAIEAAIKYLHQVAEGSTDFHAQALDHANALAMLSADYVVFEERNQWERETWKFYIPVKGNEDAIKQLRQVISRDERFACFSLSKEIMDGDEVDLRVGRSASGYMNYHNRLSGTLNVAALKAVKGEDRFQALYKGGIRNFVK